MRSSANGVDPLFVERCTPQVLFAGGGKDSGTTAEEGTQEFVVQAQHSRPHSDSFAEEVGECVDAHCQLYHFQHSRIGTVRDRYRTAVSGNWKGIAES